MKARIWVRQGNLNEAQRWVGERVLSASDDLSFLREFEHITLAWVLVAIHRLGRQERLAQEATRLLQRLLKAAGEDGRMGSAIEILTLQALAHQARDDIDAALTFLERALRLVEPEGYQRIFIDEGPAMADLLREATKHGISPKYVSRLRAAYRKDKDEGLAREPLREALSERELEVLRLLASELNGPEIARELTVSLNTMRTHTKHIYGKLGVNSRRVAVRRAAATQSSSLCRLLMPEV